MNPSCEDCSICMDALYGCPVTLTACNHGFHTACLTRWTSNLNTSCPLCRAQIVNQLPPLLPLTLFQLEEDARSRSFEATRRRIRAEFRYF